MKKLKNIKSQDVSMQIVHHSTRVKVSSVRMETGYHVTFPKNTNM